MAKRRTVQSGLGARGPGATTDAHERSKDFLNETEVELARDNQDETGATIRMRLAPGVG